MNNVVKYGIGLLALGVSVYVVGIAWKRSQKKNGSMLGFTNATGNDKLRRIGAGVQTRTGAPLGKPQCFCGGVRQDCPC